MLESPQPAHSWRSLRSTFGVGALTLGMTALFALALREDARLFERGVGLPIFRRLLVDDLGALPLFASTGLAGVVGAWLARRQRWSWSWLTDHPRSVAASVSVVCLLLSILAYQRHPLAMDESVPVFQARVFAAGRLSASFEPEALRWLFSPPFLGGFFTASTQGHVTSVYWPGFALALAPFELLGIGFVLNPLLAGASVWLLREVALEVSLDRSSAGWAMAMLVASPTFLINGASFYSMNAHLFANLAFLALVLRPSTKRLFAAGALGAWAFSLHNPFPHLLFAWPWWMAQLSGPNRTRRALSLATGYLVVGMLLVVGWQVFRSGLRPPHASAGGAFPFVVPTLAVIGNRLLGLGKLMVWAPFGLLPLAVLGALGGFRNVLVRRLALSAGSTLCGYLVVTFDQGHGWGYRYFHAAYATLPLLAALAISGNGASKRGRELLGNACAIWVALALLLLVPQRALQVRAFITEQLQQRADTSGTALECAHFIRRAGYYTGDLIQNDPWLRGRELFLTDHGDAETQQLLSRYAPDATRYRWTASDTAFCAPSLLKLKAAFLGSNAGSD